MKINIMKKILAVFCIICCFNIFQDLIAQPYDPSTPPGGETFTLVGIDGVSVVLTSFGWTLPTVGNGLVIFKANAASDIWVVFGSPSDVDRSQPQQCLAVGIGIDDNTKSVIRTTVDSDNKVSIADTITPGLDELSDSWGDYWVMVRNGKIMYGKGVTPGKNQLLQWSDPIIKTVKFVGFGCKGNTLVKLDKIKIVKAIQESAKPVAKEKETKKETKVEEKKVAKPAPAKVTSVVKRVDDNAADRIGRVAQKQEVISPYPKLKKHSK